MTEWLDVQSGFAFKSSGASCETDVNPPLMAEAIWDHVSMVPDELAFSVGDVIEVMELRDSSDVWYGYHGERFGWFPASYVRVSDEYEWDWE